MSKSKVAIIVILLIAITTVFVIMISGNKGKNEKNKEGNENLNETKDAAYEENVQVQADGTKLNKSEQLKKEKTLGTLVFKDIQLTNKNGQTVLLASVTNTGASKTDIKEVNIIVIDKDGNELGTVVGVIIPLNPGQTTTLNSSAQRDYANAYDFKVIEKN